MFDHVDIRVSDFDASTRFYDTVLGVLGKERIATEEGFAEWGAFSIHHDGQPVTQRLHVAFYAPHELVDAFHAPASKPASPATASPARGRNIRPSTTAPSSWIRTATASRPSTSPASASSARSTICGCGSPTSPPPRASTRRSRPMRASRCAGTLPTTPSSSAAAAPSRSSRASRPCNAHIAFPGDNAAVDAFHAAAVAAGYRDNGAPGKRPHYHPDYYGAFVLDPDGNNIEVVAHNR